ncbi:hypothetical protein GCM10023231_41010 [Olivibacter ginsenosidimutans]|uniref:beta-fructofuranosidase n=1 Tax=Olivibacter ginsenosidimutans TaxID=1176537 RepID=A0ABP9CB90_9SPHI
MKTIQSIEQAKEAALNVLLHNRKGPFHSLPRTAGWGYPEPYTRDLLLSLFGISVTGNKVLIKSMETVLKTLAKNQSQHGHIPSLVHDREDRGSSDSTPLFLIGIGLMRDLTGKKDFLATAAKKAMTWMDYQSPSDDVIVAQQPTSDWRDEQWVLGYGLFVNTLVYTYLRHFGQIEKATQLCKEMRHFTITGHVQHQHVHEGFQLKDKPYYALWSYKVLSNERFDLLGNSLAILSGIASKARAKKIIEWVEQECQAMQAKGSLAVDLPPNFFPFTQSTDPDWQAREAIYNNPGDYHNGGIWPFICSFYIAALVAAEKFKLAEHKLMLLTKLIKQANNQALAYGFNEWNKAQTGKPMGQNWQTWSASMYLYAAYCVQQKHTPFFDKVRQKHLA